MHLRPAFFAAAVALSAAIPVVTHAQAALPNAQPSGRAQTVVGFGASPRNLAATIKIDYGQPHARGRAVVGGLIPTNTVWRLGANEATTLTTGTDLMIGGQHVPKGTYTLFLEATATGAHLIVNKQTGQWGTQYDKAQDLVRVPMRAKKLSEPRESLVITLVPKQGAKSGDLVISWGTAEWTAEWMAH